MNLENIHEKKMNLENIGVMILYSFSIHGKNYSIFMILVWHILSLSSTSIFVKKTANFILETTPKILTNKSWQKQESQLFKRNNFMMSMVLRTANQII